MCVCLSSFKMPLITQASFKRFSSLASTHNGTFYSWWCYTRTNNLFVAAVAATVIAAR